MTMRLVTRLMLSFLQKPLQLLSKSRSCLTPAFRSQKPGLYCSGSYCRLMNLSKYRSLSSLVEAITDCHETLLRLRDAICISLNPKPNEVNISQSTIVVTATSPSTTACFSLSPPPDFPIRSPTQKSTLSFKKFTPMASLTTTNTTVGLSKTFIKLKEQGKAAATRALARGTNLNSILAMLKEVIPKLSCPIALFTYYNPILKRGVGEFMSIIKDVGVHDLIGKKIGVLTFCPQ